MSAPFSVCVDLKQQHVHQASCSAAGCVRRGVGSVRRGAPGARVPAALRRRRQRAHVPVLAGVVGLQHQHHGRELRLRGEQLDVSDTLGRRTPCHAVSVYRRRRGKSGLSSTRRGPRSLGCFPSSRSQILKSNFS